MFAEKKREARGIRHRRRVFSATSQRMMSVLQKIDN